jgi:3'-phosphoadenosine 5'-phosphosulfate sulfotransferase (PAPS reductase)/FAD synthetase
VTNPYLITGPALISFSGGRTSAYMLKMILDAHGGTLPDDVHVCFANTGKEREETLRFVHECATRWGVRVRWLERASKLSFEEVGHNSASRSGEPFNALLREKKYLPNAVTRFCTIELKIRTMKAFALSLGWAKWDNIVGLRYDEPLRVERALFPKKKDGTPKRNRERWTTRCPLHSAKASNRDVRAFWRKQDFDLQLLPFEGNCDGCFLKAYPKLVEVERTRPGTLKWWAEAEAEAKAKVTSITGKSSGAQFVTEYSYAQIADTVRRQPDMFANVFDDDPEMDAECGTWCPGS